MATQHTRVSTDRVRKSAKKGSATSELDVVRFAVRAELSRSYSASIPPLYSGLARSRATATLLARRWARACGPRTLASNAPTPHAALNGAPLQRSKSCTRRNRWSRVRATTASCSAHMVLSVRGCALPSDRSSTQPDSGPHRTGVTCVFNYPSDPHVRAPRVYRIRTTMEPSAMLSSNDEYRYDKHLISICVAQWRRWRLD